MALLDMGSKDEDMDDEKKGPSPLPFPSPTGLNLPSFVIFLLQASLPPCLFYSTRDCAPSRRSFPRFPASEYAMYPHCPMLQRALGVGWPPPHPTACIPRSPHAF